LSERRQRKIVEGYLWIYALVLVSLTALAWGVYLTEGRPELKRPLFAQNDRFRDLTNYTGKIANLRDGGEALGRGLPVYNYPAPAAYVYAFLLRGFPRHPVRAYISILLMGLFISAALLWKAALHGRTRSWGLAAAIVSTGIFGFPMIFTMDRANLEGAVGLILGTGLVLFVVGRYYGSAIFIGLAASVKPFPGLFFLLLIRKKLYKEAMVGVVAAGCSMVLALTALGPTPLAAYKGLQPGVKRYYNDYIMRVPSPTEGRFEHSIMDGLKSVASRSAHAWNRRKRHKLEAVKSTQASGQSSAESFEILAQESARRSTGMRALLPFSVFLSAGAFAFVLLRIFKLPVVNQMILLGIAITLLPPVAAEYTLLHLYVPFGVFLLFLMREVATDRVVCEQKYILTMLILFAFLFSPVTFFGIYAGDFKLLVLVGLLIIAGSYPMPSSMFKELKPISQ
jgi:hypothetical protein